MDHDIELVADKAAGVMVPAEAVEAVAHWLAAQAGWTNPGPWAEFKHRKFYEQRAGEVLAAAAPLIVADRDPNVRSLIQLVEQQREALDETAAQVARLTAERDAALARIAAVEALDAEEYTYNGLIAVEDLRAALGDTPGGPR